MKPCRRIAAHGNPLYSNERHGINPRFSQPTQVGTEFHVGNARLVVELDGGQHLASLDAYRRDRRKDALLQEYGYFVLRLLAEDVGAKLDMVLDAILRALAHRRASSGDR